VDGVLADVALLLEDLSDPHLDLGGGHGRLVVVRLIGVPQTREHVCDRISHRHGVVSLFLAGVSALR